MTEDERTERLQTLTLLRPLAEDVMLTPGRIVDASALIKQLPPSGWEGIRLQELSVPFDEVFICFGKHKSLTIDVAEGLYFEGAYVKKSNRYGRWSFDVILVGNDPDFATVDDRSLGETLRSLTRYYHLLIPGDRPLLSAVRGVSPGCDGSVLGDRSAVVAGVTMAARVVTHLAGQHVDAEMGYPAGAPKGMVEKARLDPWVQQDLNWRGYPRMVFLGRNTEAVSLAPHRDDPETALSFHPAI
ncbi:MULTISPECIES: hypothetical protein [unclassified Ensifer]|uniref:hypothetical protein n=1 Tax=unclassified Ensifer TaxID=2633371 RepID=UPI0011467C0C|nr:MULTISPECIES: hypothetical protein [unclassified Ensifer]